MSISVTSKAQQEFNKYFEKNEKSFVRIIFQSFGWGGPSFGIVLDKTKDEERDYLEKVDDLEILVEKDILNQFGNLNIDYSDSWFNKGFVVTL